MAKLSLFALIFLASFIILSPQHAQAQQKGTLVVSPAYQEVVLQNPGEEKIIEITYTNNSTQPLSLRLYPIDFKQQGEQGGISFLGKESGTYSYSLSSFLTFESNALELSPGEKRTFAIQITNRQDISPGGHYAAVIARQEQGGRETTVSPAVSSLIFMRKAGGERFNLSIQKVTWPRSPMVFSIPGSADITFQNAGNIHVVPYGTAEVKDSFGRLLYKGVLNNTSAIVMPESRRLITFSLKKVDFMYPLSFNSLEIKGADSLQKVTYVHRETFLYINPLILAGVLIGIVWAAFVSRKKKKRT